MMKPNLMRSLFCALFIGLLPTAPNALRLNDTVKLDNFGGVEYSLKDMVYEYKLEPLYRVPLRATRHTIYTGSVSEVTKRHAKRLASSISYEEYEDLEILFDGEEVPGSITADYSRKRSVGGNPNVIRVKDAFFTYNYEELQDFKRKRAILGSAQKKRAWKWCFTLIFGTTCDNGADIQSVKDAMTATTTELRAEIDDMKAVEDKRAAQTEAAFASIKDALSDLIQKNQDMEEAVATLASEVAANAALTTSADYQLATQISNINRQLQTVIKFVNSFKSTDPRAFTVQPSMTALFNGYQSVIEELQNNNSIPIVETNTFNWTEQLLSSDSLSNISFVGGYTISTSRIIGWRIITQLQCNGWFTAGSNLCVSYSPLKIDWIYGPFHPDQLGVYLISGSNNSSVQDHNYPFSPFPWQNASSGVTMVEVAPSTTLNCVDLFGFVVLTSIGATNYMTNGISSKINPRNISDCSNYMLVNGESVIHSLVTINNEGVNVPFYSNCNASVVNQLTDSPVGYLSTFTLTPQVSTKVGCYADTPKREMSQKVPLIDSYMTVEKCAIYCSDFKYMGLEVGKECYCGNALPSTQNDNACYNLCSDGNSCGGTWALTVYDLTLTDIYNNVEVYSKHGISPDCYINLEPSWIGADYYIDDSAQQEVIQDIPMGFQISQFIVHPDTGTLSSSLSFMWTTRWAWVYSIQRISTNPIMITDLDDFNGNKVLFDVTKNQIVDESDSILGEGVNGRDCIQIRDLTDVTFHYDTTQCMFQNDDSSYAAEAYVKGIVHTSGISRFSERFVFQVQWNDTENIKFTLKARDVNEYDFYVSLTDSMCPEKIDQYSYTDHCSVKLRYTGSQPVTVSSDDYDSASTTLSFSNSITTLNIRLGSSTITVGGADCLQLNCFWSQNNTIVTLSTPNVQIIAATDSSLYGTINSYFASYGLENSMSILQDVVMSSKNASEILGNISNDVMNIPISILKDHPFQDFVEWRKAVDNTIDGIKSTSTSSDTWLASVALTVSALSIVASGVAVFMTLKG